LKKIRYYSKLIKNNMAVGRGLASSTLVEVIDRILDKGLVVDFWVTVALIGIEIVSIEGRVVVASVETYLKYAEAMGLSAGV
jgi:gas vesicle structural protein